MPAWRMVMTILSALYLVSMMFALGLEVGGAPKEPKHKKRAKRRFLVWSLVVNLVVLPAVAYAIVHAIHATGDVAIALMLLAAVPGGRFAPHFVKLGGGDLPLAIELTLFLAKITAFTAAPTARILLGISAVDVHELPLILQLIALQLVPLYVGKWLRRKYPETAALIQRPAHAVALTTMVVAFLWILLREDRGILHIMDDRAWLAVLTTGVAWPLIGWLLAGRDNAHRRTLAITADARELALALVLAGLAFPSHSVQTGLFGIWSIYVIMTLLLAAGMRALPKTKSRGPQQRAPATAHSAEAH